MLPRNGTVNDPEQVLNIPSVAPNFGSGGKYPQQIRHSRAMLTSNAQGGFSNFYPTPSYQAAAVQNYLDNYVPK